MTTHPASMGQVPHPARFSRPILAAIASVLDDESCRVGHPLTVLDPFAGAGGVHTLADRSQLGVSIRSVGVELEPEWASQHPRTIVGDATALPFADSTFDAIVTSPTYGNRMADHHNARDGSRRITYRHILGRPLTPGNSGAMQWGEPYRELHRRAWAETARMIVDGGLLVVNVSNHIRQRQVVPVVDWHVSAISIVGLIVEDLIEVPTSRLRFGANHSERVKVEHIVVARRPTGPVCDDPLYPFPSTLEALDSVDGESHLGG